MRKLLVLLLGVVALLPGMASGQLPIGTQRHTPALEINNLWTGSNSFSGPVTFGGGNPWFDVTSGIFNAKCDGVTDDTTAIQAAITAAKLLGGVPYIPDGKTCVVASNSSPALSLDLAQHTGISCGVPNGRSRPGGGLTNTCAIRFTGTPAIGLSARGSFGVAINGVAIYSSNPSFTGTLIDVSHAPGDTSCGGSPCDTENFTLINSTVSGTGSGCTLGLSFDKTIQSFVQNSHFFGCVTQLMGATAAGSYSNVNKILESDFFGSPEVTCFIKNPGETWKVSGNVFEANAASASTVCNAGSFADTNGLAWVSNWDGDDTGVGAYTKYVFGANTVANFESSEISATHNNVNAFSFGNNSKITFGGGMTYVGSSTFGTMFTVGTGVSLDMAPATYGSFTAFMSGSPAAGTVTTSTGEKRTFGNAGFNLPFANTSKASVHAQAQTGSSTGNIPTITGNAGVIADSSVDTSGAAGAGKVYGVIGVARTLNSLAGDKSYGGWFKSAGVNSSAEEVGLHAEVTDAQLNSTILEGAVQGAQKFRFDGFGNFYFTNLLFSSTAPTISSGFGTSPQVAVNNGTASFNVNVGTGGTATNGVIGMPTATTGWNCTVFNITAHAGHRADDTVQTASTTASVTIENQTKSTGAAVAWTASDSLRLMCFAN